VPAAPDAVAIRIGPRYCSKARIWRQQTISRNALYRQLSASSYENVTFLFAQCRQQNRY
jgi:hypothetical protein